MTEMLKCKCGLPPMMFPQTGPKGDYWQVGCPCGRSGRAISSKEEAIASWNTDRLAEEKAKEALHHAFGLITEPGDWDSATIEGEISEGLRLLEGR